MPTLTVRPGIANSNLIAAIRSTNATYSVARDGTGTFTAFDSGADFVPGGQNTNYDIREMFFGFDLGITVPGAVVTDVKFEFTTYGSNVTGGETQAILDYTADNVLTSDWQDGTELAALTSFGSLAKGSYMTNSTTYQYSMNAAARTAAQTALRAGGRFSFMIVDQNVIDNVAPVANDNWYICSEQHATEANRPAVIITYYLPTVKTYHYLRQTGV